MSDGLRVLLLFVERTPVANIGYWRARDMCPQPLIPDLEKWAESVGVDAVIWTALPPKFGADNVIATAERVIAYLQGLTGAKKARAENYVRKAPAQITTRYRSAIEAELGWTGVKE